jgi:hypothetical protein
VLRFLGILQRHLKASSRIPRNRNGHARDATVPVGFSLQNITQASIAADTGHSLSRNAVP